MKINKIIIDNFKLFTTLYDTLNDDRIIFIYTQDYKCVN